MKRFTAIILSAFTCILAFSIPCSLSAQTCEQWTAKAISVEGVVEFRSSANQNWLPVSFESVFCRGDAIRVKENSRAGLLLRNGANVRLDENTTVMFTDEPDTKGIIAELIRGAAHFLSRVPRSLRIITPFMNGSVEGTEFIVQVQADRTFLHVYEGTIMAANEHGGVTITRGQSVTAAGGPPVFQTVLKPQDAVQWAIYYPLPFYYSVKDVGAAFPLQNVPGLGESIGHYRNGRIPQALAAAGSIAEDVRGPWFYVYRASLLLAAGSPEQAMPDIMRALETDRDNADALALMSIVSLAENDNEKAYAFAKRAVSAAPSSSAARIALSYALQARFDLQEALRILEEAAGADSGNVLLLARISELQLCLGNKKRALQEAGKAAALDPGFSRLQTVRGFASLASSDINNAISSFRNAILRDQADPLPRLGLGLAIIRRGDVPAGLQEIQNAVSLDPANALMRSYLGKAYHEERLYGKASDQFQTARQLDPNDPTPLFYGALLSQDLNMPAQALRLLEKSVEMNDNRAVFRSRLLLDEDLAVRSTDLARIYGELGFTQRALSEGWRAVAADPASHSAHRFLSETYSALPRHEIARVSELLQSQLLQPLNITPVPPHLAESSLFIPGGIVPSGAGYNEFTGLFNRDRFSLMAGGIAGELGTYGNEIVHSAVSGRLSYSVGQFHYETDGFRPNSDYSRDILNAFVQGSISRNTTMQAEFRYDDTSKGDLTLRFFPEDYSPFLRDERISRLVRLGINHEISPASRMLSSFIYSNADSKLHDMPVPGIAFDAETDEESFSAEVQHIFRTPRISVVSGIGHFSGDRSDKLTTGFALPDEGLFTEEKSSGMDHTNVYLYSHIRHPDKVTWVLGVSGDFMDGAIVSENQINPKLGILWEPFGGLTLRGAVFRTLKRSLINDQTLEPVTVAGFNQFFDDGEGTDAWRLGAGADYRLSGKIYTGAELSRRWLDVPFESIPLPPQPPVPEVEKASWKETFARVYLYWMPDDRFSLSAEYLREKFDRDRDFAAGIEKVTTDRVPLGLAFHHPSGLTAKAKAVFINQDGYFIPQMSDSPQHGREHFWIFDASVTFRLPKGSGLIALEARNLFDKDFRFQDTDPSMPAIQPSRMVLARISVAW